MLEVDEETKRKIISEEMARRCKNRWAKTTKEERHEYGKKLAKARWEKERKNNV